MFYYTFSVINTMFVSCTALLFWQHSSNSGIKIVHISIEHFLWNPSDFFSDDVLSCLWIVFTNAVFQAPPGWREMSLPHRKLCLRYSSVLFEKWGATSEILKVSIFFQKLLPRKNWDIFVGHHVESIHLLQNDLRIYFCVLESFWDK